MGVDRKPPAFIIAKEGDMLADLPLECSTGHWVIYVYVVERTEDGRLELRQDLSYSGKTYEECDKEACGMKRIPWEGDCEPIPVVETEAEALLLLLQDT